MKGKLILVIIVMIGSGKMGAAQDGGKVLKDLKNLYYNLDDLHGNLFFFNKYCKSDTSYFSEFSLRKSVGIIKSYAMKRINVNFDSLLNYIPVNKIRDENSFGKTIYIRPVFNADDARYSMKMDSVINNNNRIRVHYPDDTLLNDSLAHLEDLLMTNVHTSVIRNKAARAQKKLFKVLDVYESDKFRIIIYSVFMSLIDSYISSELILK